MANTLVAGVITDIDASSFEDLDLGHSFLPEAQQPTPNVQADAFFRLFVLSVGTFVVRAANEEHAWVALTEHGSQHPSLKIGRPLEMLPGMAISALVDDREAVTAGIVSAGYEPYVRAEQFFEPSHSHIAKHAPQKSTTQDTQGTLPLVYPFRHY